jgi:hypothetical protein
MSCSQQPVTCCILLGGDPPPGVWIFWTDVSEHSVPF